MYSHSYASPLVNWIGHFWRMCPYTESSSKGLMIPLRSWFLSPPDVRAATLKVTVGGTKVSKLGLFSSYQKQEDKPSCHGRGRAFLHFCTEEDEPSSSFFLEKNLLKWLRSCTSTNCHNLPMRCEDRTTKFNGQLGKVKAASASHFHASAHSASVKIL